MEEHRPLVDLNMLVEVVAVQELLELLGLLPQVSLEQVVLE
tara:strand:+ start:248 stop:370 length:123 start_codon:yes stop_codon:yes gene_type:complete